MAPFRSSTDIPAERHALATRLAAKAAVAAATGSAAAQGIQDTADSVASLRKMENEQAGQEAAEPSLTLQERPGRGWALALSSPSPRCLRHHRHRLGARTVVAEPSLSSSRPSSPSFHCLHHRCRSVAASLEPTLPLGGRTVIYH